MGNSAGVILPREWLNGRARIELISKPLDIKKEVLDLLDEYLEEIQGIYLVGSYARGEQTEQSDIDILVITNNTTKIIEKGKYNITLVSKEVLEKQLQDNIFPILPMLFEAKALLNGKLIENYKKAQLTKKNLKWHIETTKSILNVIREQIKMDKLDRNSTNDAVAYSLILRLRGTYIVDCLKNNKIWSNKVLLQMIKKISGSLKAYEGYLRTKQDKKLRMSKLPIDEAEKLYTYVYNKIREQEKWVKREK